MVPIARKIAVFMTAAGATVLFALPMSATDGDEGAGSGTFAEMSFLGTPTVTTTVDGTTMVAQSTAGTFTGAISGTFTEVLSAAVFSDGSQTFSGLDVCVCSVGGHSGTFADSFSGTGIVPNFTAKLRVLRGTGSLSNLHGTAKFSGAVNQNTGLASGQYSIRFRFGADS